MREPKKTEEKPAAVEEAQLIENIRKSMEKDQYYLLCQYAISIVEAKAKIIDEQLSMKYGREIMRSVSGRVKSPESIYAKLMRKELPADLETAGKKLNDLVGVRIVCLFLDDVYEIAEILKKQRDPDPYSCHGLLVCAGIPADVQEESVRSGENRKRTEELF